MEIAEMVRREIVECEFGTVTEVKDQDGQTQYIEFATATDAPPLKIHSMHELWFLGELLDAFGDRRRFSRQTF